MSVYDIKNTMDKIHISEEMQEEIIRNVMERTGETAGNGGQKKEESGTKCRRNTERFVSKGQIRRRLAAAAALLLLAGVVGIPVRAVVINVVKARMDNIPKEELREIEDIVQHNPAEADVFSREYSEEEKERNIELWKAYKNGRFPQNAIAQADNEEDAPEGELCYIVSTCVFNLPEREMTDEEMLEIIDFQHKMSYAVEQGLAAQEAKAEMLDEQEKLLERVEALGGVGMDAAEEIAVKRMKDELGDDAEDTEFRMISLMEDDEAADDGLVYHVYFRNPEVRFWYECVIDAVGGEILWTEVF